MTGSSCWSTLPRDPDRRPVSSSARRWRPAWPSCWSSTRSTVPTPAWPRWWTRPTNYSSTWAPPRTRSSSRSSTPTPGPERPPWTPTGTEPTWRPSSMWSSTTYLLLSTTRTPRCGSTSPTWKPLPTSAVSPSAGSTAEPCGEARRWPGVGPMVRSSRPASPPSRLPRHSVRSTSRRRDRARSSTCRESMMSPSARHWPTPRIPVRCPSSPSTNPPFPWPSA